MASKKSKTTSLKITDDTVHDCLSSWLTATGFISRNQLVVGVQREDEGYTILVKEADGD